MLFFLFFHNLNSTLSPTRYGEHLFRCVNYFTVLLETSLFRFFTTSLGLSAFPSLMISLDGCKHGCTTGSLSFSIAFPHWSSSLNFLPKYTSEAHLQPSSSLFSLLSHFVYLCKFFDQFRSMTNLRRSFVIFFLKDLCDCSTFSCEFFIFRSFFFCKTFWVHHKIPFLYHFEVP